MDFPVTRYAVLDVETTGLAPASGDRVVEIAVIVLDDRFRVVRFFETLVQPLRRIPAEVTRIHGISDADVSGAPAFQEIFPDLVECLTGVTHLVAHNISFDLGFLSAEIAASGHQLPSKHGRICTMKLARAQAVAHDAKLGTVARALGVRFPGDSHRAAVDAGVTARILPLLLKKAPGIETSAVIQWPNAGPPRHLCRRRKPCSARAVTLAELGLSVE